MKRVILMMMAAVMCSCAGTKLTPDVMMSDGLSVAAAAGAGYLTGGKAGAVLGATTAGVGNLQRLAKTSAKQPVGKVTP